MRKNITIADTMPVDTSFRISDLVGKYIAVNVEQVNGIPVNTKDWDEQPPDADKDGKARRISYQTAVVMYNDALTRVDADITTNIFEGAFTRSLMRVHADEEAVVGRVISGETEEGYTYYVLALPGHPEVEQSKVETAKVALKSYLGQL